MNQFLDIDLPRDPSIENESVGILLVDTEGRLLSVNRFATQLFQIDISLWRGHSVSEIARDANQAGPFADILEHIANVSGFAQWEGEFVLGGVLYVLRMHLVLQGLEYSILVEDISERRAIESRFKAILGSSKDGVVVVDETGIIVWPNSRFGNIFGFHWRQFKGMRFVTAVDLIGDCFSETGALRSFLHDVEKTPEKHHEIILSISWPQMLDLQISTRAISNDRGRNIGRVWTFADISEFKSLEQQLRDINQELEVRVNERTQEIQVRNADLEAARKSLQVANDALEAELDMAKQVQDGLLPERLPDLKGWELHAEYMPTGKVGGDFFDIVDLGDGSAFLIMADVSGHGVPAALVTAMAKMAFLRHVKASVDFSVSEILRQVNSDLVKAIRTDHYLTVFAGHLQIDSGRLRYSRVCHPYPFIIRADGDSDRITQRGGFFIGMNEDSLYEEAELVIGHGDLLFLYTDGLNETTDPRGRQFGMHRLEAALLSSHLDGPAAAVHNALAQREGFACGKAPNDDITVLALRRR